MDGSYPSKLRDESFYPIWFSYIGHKHYSDSYDLTQKAKLNPWKWKQCKISFFKISDEKIRFIIRREQIRKFSSGVKLPWKKENNTSDSWINFKLKYMIGFDVDVRRLPTEVLEKSLEEPLDHAQTRYGPPRNCWTLELGDEHLIWEWKEEGKSKESSIIYEIFNQIQRKREAPTESSKFFNIQLDYREHSSIVPVVYHPAKDLRGTKNYIREIHCYRETPNSNKIQVTIIFNNEQLREHKIVDQIYKSFRLLRFGRIFDVESFNIILDKENPVKFDFPNIYSKSFKVNNDNIHEDACGVDVKYYFGDIKHPIIFINTANHAMAEHDANYTLWKLEYWPWVEECPIFFGNESRCAIEKRFRTVFLNPLLFLGCNNHSYTQCKDK